MKLFARVAIAAVMVAAVASYPAAALPGGGGDGWSSASATFRDGKAFVNVEGYSGIDGSSPQICVAVIDKWDGMFEFGCASGVVDIDPALRVAHLSGTIPTTLWDRSGDGGTNSTIAIDVALTGTGIPQIYQGASQGTGIGPSPWAEVDAGAGLTRDASATGRVASSSMRARGKSFARGRKAVGGGSMQEALWAGVWPLSSECYKSCD